MNTFLRTFVICLFVTLGFLGYRFMQHDSFSPDLAVSESNPVFHRIEKFDRAETALEKTEKPASAQDKKAQYTCFFYSNSGKLVPVKREVSASQNLENTLIMLLKGPTIKESQQGIYSEIPKNVDLLSLKEDKNSVIVNLSGDFSLGGGSDSLENRVKQLSKTIKATTDKKIYLYIDNEEVEYLGGEGVYIKQPLE